MARVEVFSYKDASFVVYNDNGVACFKIGDILFSLGEKTTNNLHERLEDRDYHYFNHDVEDVPYHHEGVNEMGLFRLILTSPNKEEADHFYKWVVSRILPYITQFIRNDLHTYHITWASFFSDVLRAYDFGENHAEKLWSKYKIPFPLPDKKTLKGLSEACLVSSLNITLSGEKKECKIISHPKLKE